jgi:hypothetical protein
VRLAQSIGERDGWGWEGEGGLREAQMDGSGHSSRQGEGRSLADGRSLSDVGRVVT